MEKKALRNHNRKIRNAQSEDVIQDKSNDIAEALFSIPEYIKATNILIYMHYGSEVKTDTIIEHSLKAKKHVFVPRVIGKNMEFFEITSFADCETGYMGILEPKENLLSFSTYCRMDHNHYSSCGTEPNQISSDDFIFSEYANTIMIMPGLAFDNLGNRIGYGGGFYDIYLSDKVFACKIGIAFDFQTNEKISPEPFDQKTDYVVTEKRVIHIFHK